MRNVSSFVRVFILLIAAFALAAAPAMAQEEEGSSGVSCDPESPSAGSTTDCTAEGLAPNSDFQWTAEFTDGSTEEGEGTADMVGTGTFTVQIPESAPLGGYQVTVTGEDPEGNEYEESHQGLITPSGGEDGGDDGGDDAGDDSGDTGGDDGGDTGGDDFGDDGDDFGEEEGQSDFTTTDETPEGGVATGAGGTAGSSPLLPILLVIGLAAVAGTLGYRRWATHRS